MAGAGDGVAGLYDLRQQAHLRSPPGTRAVAAFDDTVLAHELTSELTHEARLRAGQLVVGRASAALDALIEGMPR